MRAIVLFSFHILLSACEVSSTALPSEALAPSRLTERWRAGGIDETGGVILQSPVWDAAIGDAAIGVVARGGDVLILESADGSVRTAVGRRGGGPGEFVDPRRVGFVGDSLLWVTDVRHGRVTWFNLQGVFRGELGRPPQPVPQTHWSVRGDALLTDGAVLGSAYGPDENLGDEIDPLPVVLWDPMGDMGVVEWVDRVAPSVRRIPTSRGMPISGPQPLQATPIVDAAQGGQWFFVLDRTPAEGRNAMVTVDRYGPDGRPIDRMSIPYEPIPVSGDMIEHFRGMAEAYRDQIPAQAGQVRPEDVMDATWIPSTLPPVREAYADRSGLWLWRERYARDRIMERYDLEGRLIARAEIPERHSPITAAGTSILTASSDSLGVVVLTLYDVEFSSNPRGDDK